MARGRKRMIAGWGLIALGVGVAGAVVASRWYMIGTREYAGWSLGISEGGVELARGWKAYSGRGFNEDTGPVDPPSLNWTMRELGPPYEQLVHLKVFAVVRRSTATVGTILMVGFLLWPIALASFAGGVPLVLSARRIRRRAKHGLCPSCGYALAGLAAGAACPECGKAR